MSTVGIDVGEAEKEVSKWWWLWLLAGIIWVILSLAILRANKSSVTVMGVIIGILFVLAGIQELFVAYMADSWRWLWAIFGVLFLVGGIIMLAYPNKTFIGFAEILGWVFLVFGVLWIIEAVQQKQVNDLWWLTLIAGILLVVLAFWSSAQFLTTKTYVLLLFSGIWALLHGITDIINAFQVRKMGKVLQ